MDLMDRIDDMLRKARASGCSDLHLSAGLPPIVRLDGKLTPLAGEPPLSAVQVEELAHGFCAEAFGGDSADGDLDLCFVDRAGLRYRINRYREQGHIALAARLLHSGIPTLEELHLPPVLKNLAMLPRGLILVTGPTGSGKSTTLAAMLDYINRNRTCHILTMEDPIEYLHTHKKSMIHQREIGSDAGSFAAGLRSALREDPDVILVGEMRDLETISAAVTAAETGHLVLSTLHTTGAAATIDRIIDVFPPHQQQQIRTQLAMVLRGVVSQQLLPLKNGGRTAALEVLMITDAAANLIRENKCHQLNTVLQTGAKFGMQSMDMNLAQLCQSGQVSVQEALEHCLDEGTFRKLAQVQ